MSLGFVRNYVSRRFFPLLPIFAASISGGTKEQPELTPLTSWILRRQQTDLMVVRAFLGVAEGGLLPGIVLYLSMCYKRSEMALRLGLIYSSASLSGA